MAGSILFEACVDSLESALAAAAGGADRVELCAGLLEGGLTPSDGTLRLVRQRLTLPLHVLIRPRGGDFCYSETEFEVMRLDLQRAHALEADGVVLGILRPDGTVDRERTAVLAELARPMSVTFHRAIDVARDPHEALEVLIGLGIDRVLTSGQEATALEGVEGIAALVQQAADRIMVMAGAGITERNVARIVAQTGVREVHATARALQDSRMVHRNPRCPMGGALRPEEYAVATTSTERVCALVEALPSS
ncbi:MAG: copper homeostasis protein CutC [Candidatus Latescibacterota bacterium]